MCVCPRHNRPAKNPTITRKRKATGTLLPGISQGQNPPERHQEYDEATKTVRFPWRKAQALPPPLQRDAPAGHRRIAPQPQMPPGSTPALPCALQILHPRPERRDEKRGNFECYWPWLANVSARVRIVSRAPCSRYQVVEISNILCRRAEGRDFSPAVELGLILRALTHEAIWLQGQRPTQQVA